MRILGFNYSVNNYHVMTVPFGSSKPTGQYRNCPQNKPYRISIQAKGEAQNCMISNVTHHLQNPVSYIYIFLIIVYSITGSNTTCINVIFKITKFRNNYINCCILRSLLNLLGKALLQTTMLLVR
jgi:hypothetical protein